MKKVAHIVRKILPTHVSFLRNQIMSHQAYDVCVIFKEFVPSRFAEEILRVHPCLNCDAEKTGIRKSFSNVLYRRPFRMLTRGDQKAVRDFLSHQKPSILHFHYGTDAGFFISATRSSYIPSVVSFYGYDCNSFPRWFGGLGIQYLRNVFKHVDFCIAMSEDMKSDLVRIGCPESKVKVHYYGTDTKRFVCSRSYNDRSYVTVLIVAGLYRKKGHIHLLKAVKNLSKSIQSRVRLRIVGNGPLRNELSSYARLNKLTDIVTFVGYLDYMSKQIFYEYQDADIFVHPSVVASDGDKEGIPGTIVEAMAAGLPVISTYHAGIPYIIQHGKTGFLVEERDVDGLTAWMTKLITDSELRMKIGKEAQKYALRKLDLKQKEIELENIYDQVTENHKRK